MRHARGPRADGARQRPGPSRRSATPGTFGPDLCAPGYVWREAVPGDHVCVTPATWQQVHDDNLTAGARRNALRVKVGHDAAHRRPTGCTPTASTSASRASRCSARADAARAVVAVVARRSADGPGGELSFDTRLPVCGDAPERDRPRARPVVAALVLVAPDRDGLRAVRSRRPTS